MSYQLSINYVSILYRWPLLTYSATNNGVTFKYKLGVTQHHWKWHHDRSHGRSYSSSIGSMVIHCVVSAIKRDIGQKTPFFHTPFYLTDTIAQNPFEFLFKISTQTVRVPKLLASTPVTNTIKPHCTYGTQGTRLSLTGRDQHHITVLLVDYYSRNNLVTQYLYFKNPFKF